MAVSPRQAGGPAPHGRAPAPTPGSLEDSPETLPAVSSVVPKQAPLPVSLFDVGEGWHLPTLGSPWVAGG